MKRWWFLVKLPHFPINLDGHKKQIIAVKCPTEESMWEKKRVQLQKSNFIKMMMTLKISKLTKMTTERRVRTCRSQPMFFPADLAYQVIFLLCVFPENASQSQSANFVHWFSDKCHRKSMTLWYFNVSQFHIIYLESIVLSWVINNSDFSSPLDCKTETKYLM